MWKPSSNKQILCVLSPVDHFPPRRTLKCVRMLVKQQAQRARSCDIWRARPSSVLKTYKHSTTHTSYRCDTRYTTYNNTLYAITCQEWIVSLMQENQTHSLTKAFKHASTKQPFSAPSKANKQPSVLADASKKKSGIEVFCNLVHHSESYTLCFDTFYSVGRQNK